MPKSGVITLLQMDGSLTEEEFNQALDIGIAACKKINEIQVEALKRKYISVKEQAEERHEPQEAKA
jgi:exosome complex component RRP41